jgi:hypothetical protein
VDSDPWHVRIFIQKACSNKTGKERNNKMNESSKQKQPEKESFAIFGILMGVIGLGLLAALLKLVGLF